MKAAKCVVKTPASAAGGEQEVVTVGSAWLLDDHERVALWVAQPEHRRYRVTYAAALGINIDTRFA